MTDRTAHVVAAIDGALEDLSVSYDAMRWQPDGFPRGLMLGAPAPAWIAPEVWDDAAVPIPHLPAEPLVADPVGDTDPAELERHGSVTWDMQTGDADFGDLYPVKFLTGSCWVSCGCGWTANPPDGIGGTMPVDRGSAFRAWARHVPMALHAAALARRRWLADHPGVLFLPEGWDERGGAYDWRTWSVTVADTETGGRIEVRWPT